MGPGYGSSLVFPSRFFSSFTFPGVPLNSLQFSVCYLVATIKEKKIPQFFVGKSNAKNSKC